MNTITDSQSRTSKQTQSNTYIDKQSHTDRQSHTQTNIKIWSSKTYCKNSSQYNKENIANNNGSNPGSDR